MNTSVLLFVYTILSPQDFVFTALKFISAQGLFHFPSNGKHQ